MIAWLAAAALATPAFDPSTPAARFVGDQTWTQDGAVRLWDAIERWEDPDRTLFTAESFNAGTTWNDTSASPWIRSCFGTGTPHSSAFLLHVGIHEPTAEGTPILLVPGAGDNGTRAYVTLGTRLDRANRPVYAMTFAHPHGDVFQQAEAVANAIAAVKARTGAAQIDVVAHSKGGVAAIVYASHGADAAWGDAAYASKGTAYRDDVRRLVLVGTPIGGIDTAYRWTAGNALALDADAALTPTSWSKYYPYGTGNPYVVTDLAEQDFHPEGGDLFPGQRQLLARQSAPLPGSQSWLGGYALQPDWYTTYEGGYGYSSYSEGIDAAIADGGGLVAKIAARGVDPDVAIYLLAGSNPLMPNGDEAFEELWSGVATEAEWRDLIDEIDAHGVPMNVSEDELDGLENGKLVLGEVTGRSDGLVFLSSALAEAALTKRGAKVVQTYTADLSHIDLLYASPITGQLLVDAGTANPTEDGWMRAVGARYIAADTLGWIETALADPEVPDTDEPADTGDTGDTVDTDPNDSDGPDPDDTDAVDDTGRGPAPRPCGGCVITPGGTPGATGGLAAGLPGGTPGATGGLAAGLPVAAGVSPAVWLALALALLRRSRARP